MVVGFSRFLFPSRPFLPFVDDRVSHLDLKCPVASCYPCAPPRCFSTQCSYPTNLDMQPTTWVMNLSLHHRMIMSLLKVFPLLSRVPCFTICCSLPVLSAFGQEKHGITPNILAPISTLSLFFFFVFFWHFLALYWLSVGDCWVDPYLVS